MPPNQYEMFFEIPVVQAALSSKAWIIELQFDDKKASRAYDDCVARSAMTITAAVDSLF